MAHQSTPFEQHMKDVGKVCTSAVICLCYCYFISRKIPIIFLRFLSLLPIIYLFCILPTQFSSFHLGAPITFNLVWLANFKLLLLAFNQGTLSQTSNFFHFLALAALPIKIRHNPIRKTPNSQHPSHKITQKTHPSSQYPIFTKKGNKFGLGASLLLAIIKATVFAIVIHLYRYKPYMNPYLLTILYSIHLYIYLEFVLAISALPVKIILGLELEWQFKRPYFTTSLQDFWGRRWNLMVPRLLRETVYRPIRRTCEPVLGHTGALVLGIMAVFTVSGLMHEVLFYYGTRGASPTWEVTWFLVFHGICLVIELLVKKMVGHKWQPNRVVSGMLSLGFLLVTACWWLYPQMMRSGADDWAIRECFIVQDFIKENIYKYI